MVAAVSAIFTQAGPLALGEGNSNNAQLAQFGAIAIYNFPADFGDFTQVGAVILAESNPIADLSQFGAVVLYKYRSADPRVRAWTFTLDGHDYYVLQLGEIETLIYDTHSKQWYVWGDADGDIWKLNCGINWTSAGTLMNDYGSNVLVGDYANGALYMLDPDYIYDDDRWNEGNEQRFTRFAQGQIEVRGPDLVSCYGVQLLGTPGEADADGLGVSLLYSDDRGKSYEDAGAITVAVGDYAARIEWWSLGSMNAPGRLFRIQDDGALASLDCLELLNGPAKS